jgi:hypothetical protein
MFGLSFVLFSGDEGIAILRGAHGVSGLWPSPPDISCDIADLSYLICFHIYTSYIT